MADDTKPIELWPCGYDARCNVRNCKAKRTRSRGAWILAGDRFGNMSCVRYSRSSCAEEKLKGRDIVRRGGGP
jgi:hypothetical protein